MVWESVCGEDVGKVWNDYSGFIQTQIDYSLSISMRGDTPLSTQWSRDSNFGLIVEFREKNTSWLSY